MLYATLKDIEETKMKAKRKIIEIDEEKCNGCGQCVEACAEGAIQLFNGKARLVADNYCDGLSACVGECPVDALKIVEREADAFDAEAVEHYLEHLRTPNPPPSAVAEQLLRRTGNSKLAGLAPAAVLPQS